MSARAAHGILNRIVKVEATEVAAMLWSFAYFFCLLCGYYILRPVRDEMGIQAGLHDLPWLFTGTFVAMLVAVPVFGWVTSRFPRRLFIPGAYLFFIVNLLVFFALFSAKISPQYTAKAFFIWLSIFNLFVVSVFWSFMADLFSNAQARRLFGFIAAGGSTGALVGPIITGKAVYLLGPALLLPVSACFLLAAVFCVTRLSTWSQEQPATSPMVRQDAQRPIGGSIFGGLTLLLRSDYLLGIGLYVILFTLLSTFLYFQQAYLVAASISDPAERIALFALIDQVVNSAAIIGQLLVVNRIIGRYGVAITLMLMPALAVVGFFVLGLVPTLAVLLVFGCMRRAGEYAISKPAREILFTVVSREEKYKAKNFIDTVMVRGGDAASGWFFEGLRLLGLGLSGISFVAVPIAVLWTSTAYLLGRRQEQLRTALTAKRRDHIDDTGPQTPIDSQNSSGGEPAATTQLDPR